MEHDAMDVRSCDAFAYNERGEVVFSRKAAENAEVDSYGYDDIGNLLHSSLNGVTNAYVANALNQYASLCVSVPPCETKPSYDADGSMTQFGPWTYAYDSANRLSTVSSNGVLLVANSYDAKGRRVRKTTSDAATTFFYDGWNLVEERIVRTDGTASTMHYYWGKDVSGTLHDAGGIGGLLCLTVDGVPYVPCCDANGNITRYVDANGSTVAQYEYDAFGRTVSQTGPLSAFFRHRFSTKYLDSETGLYYYGCRFYSPPLMRWLNRDPIEEDGGLNLYAFCGNNAINRVDRLGQAHFEVRALKGSGAIWSYSCFAAIIGVVPAVVLDLGLADKLNIEILHEHLFYDDGSNVGYSKEGYITKENKTGYFRRDNREYDDCIMKEAQKRVSPPPYSLIGWGRPKYNCQDYADSLRHMYDAIKDNPDVKCKCKKGLQ